MIGLLDQTKPAGISALGLQHSMARAGASWRAPAFGKVPGQRAVVDEIELKDIAVTDQRRIEIAKQVGRVAAPRGTASERLLTSR